MSGPFFVKHLEAMMMVAQVIPGEAWQMRIDVGAPVAEGGRWEWRLAYLLTLSPDDDERRSEAAAAAKSLSDAIGAALGGETDPGRLAGPDGLWFSPMGVSSPGRSTDVYMSVMDQAAGGEVRMLLTRDEATRLRDSLLGYF